MERVRAAGQPSQSCVSSRAGRRQRQTAGSMTTKIIITPASHGLSKASLAGAPRTVRVVTVGAPTASRTGTAVTQTRTVLTPSAGGVRTILTPSSNGVRTVLKRVYSATRPVETSAVTSVPALPAVPVPPRKRQRLDHLTADQKNQRRSVPVTAIWSQRSVNVYAVDRSEQR